MDKLEAAQERTKSLFIKIIVLMVFIGLMTGFIFYFNKNIPDVKYLAMENLQQRFAQSVSNSHWQWQAEGRPNMIILIHYEPRPDRNNESVEKDRRPVAMSLHGYPRAEPSSEGCSKLWQMILNMPLEVKGFKVFTEFFADPDKEDDIDEAKCRFRLSVGPSFEYSIASGQVSGLNR